MNILKMTSGPGKPGYHKKKYCEETSMPTCKAFLHSSSTTRQLSSPHFFNLIPRRQGLLMLGGALSKCYIYIMVFILIPIPKDIFLSRQVFNKDCSKSKDWKNSSVEDFSGS